MEAEYPNSFGYNPRPSPASMTQNPDYISYQQVFLGALFGSLHPKMWLAPPPPQKKSAGI